MTKQKIDNHAHYVDLLWRQDQLSDDDELSLRSLVTVLGLTDDELQYHAEIVAEYRRLLMRVRVQKMHLAVFENDIAEFRKKHARLLRDNS